METRFSYSSECFVWDLQNYYEKRKCDIKCILSSESEWTLVKYKTWRTSYSQAQNVHVFPFGDWIKSLLIVILVGWFGNPHLQGDYFTSTIFTPLNSPAGNFDVHSTLKKRKHNISSTPVFQCFLLDVDSTSNRLCPPGVPSPRREDSMWHNGPYSQLEFC